MRAALRSQIKVQKKRSRWPLLFESISTGIRLANGMLTRVGGSVRGVVDAPARRGAPAAFVQLTADKVERLVGELHFGVSSSVWHALLGASLMPDRRGSSRIPIFKPRKKTDDPEPLRGVLGFAVLSTPPVPLASGFGRRYLPEQLRGLACRAALGSVPLASPLAGFGCPLRVGDPFGG